LKTADALNATLLALVDVMKTDTRFTADENAGLAAWSVIATASGDTTQPADMLIVSCLKKLFSSGEFYTAW